MFVAASTYCFGDLGFEDALFQISELEYDKVEIWLSEESNHLKPTTVAEDPERFVNLCRDATRMTPIAICLGEDVLPDVFQSLSKVAKLLRVTQITVPASPIGTPFNTEVDRLREFVSVAGEDGVRLSIKTQVGHLTEDPHTAVELCQSVSGLGITLDPSHYVCGPHKGRNYDQVFPYVYHTHLRDSSLEEMQVPVGLGQIEYSRLINQLRRESYDLALAVELDPKLLGDQDRHLEMRKLRMLLDTLL